jgi:hypothetical protein
MQLNKIFPIVLIFLLCSCNQDNPDIALGDQLKIRLSSDSTELILSNIPTNVIEVFREDSLDNEGWTNFFAVYKDTTDFEMRDFQPALEGRYTILDSTIIFKPKDLWHKRQPYFARCYTKELLRKPEDIISKKSINSSGGFVEYKFSFTN